jgi:hypothetical protein
MPLINRNLKFDGIFFSFMVFKCGKTLEVGKHKHFHLKSLGMVLEWLKVWNIKLTCPCLLKQTSTS